MTDLQSAALLCAAIALTILAAVCIYRVSPRQVMAHSRLPRGTWLSMGMVAWLLACVCSVQVHGLAAGLVLVCSALMMALITVPSWVVWTRRGA